MSESELPHDAAGLNAAQQALLRKRLRDALTAASAPPSIPPRPNRQEFPLSFAQERFWFLDQIDQGSAAYNRPVAFRLHGPLSVPLLENALSEVVRRHEVLRAVFAAVDGQAQQVIQPPFTVQLPIVDLSALAEEQRETQARELARQETRRPFHLSDSPAWRATLLRLAANRHILLLPTHHVISDAWSTCVLQRELATLYAAFVQGLPSPLDELPIQYADYAHWQRQSFQGAALEQRLSYWKRQLANLPASLDLPPDRPRPRIDTDHGQNVCLQLPPDLTRALRTLSQAHNVTLFMTLLAAFQTLLYRYTGQQDIVVGSPVAGRAPAETEGLIGCFINTLVLRADLSGNPTFRTLLAAVRDSCLDAYTHSDLPFEKLLAALNPVRDLSRSPLFQVMFNSHLLPMTSAMPASDLTLSEFSFDSGVAQFDLSVDIGMSPNPAAVGQATAASRPSVADSTDDGGLTCVFNYNTDLFDEATIQRMLGHYCTLLQGIVSDPGERIALLPLLSPAECQQMLVTWNRTEKARPPQCLHQIVEDQAQRTPTAPAVTFEGQSLTYAQLNGRANQLAHYLRRHGVGPESIVAIQVRRSLHMPVALLGILKAGGAYVPLDPDYPRERVAFILQQSGARLLLTEQALPTIPSDATTAAVQTIYVDSARAAFDAESSENPPNLTAPENLAYVIYTSGSTGRPKGVMVSHQSVCNHALWYSGAFLHADDRALQIAALTFDASLAELFPTFAAGARLILAAPQAEMDPAALVELMAGERVTILVAVPTLLQALLDEPGFAACTHLRFIMCGGEAMSAALEAQTRLRTQAALIHCYGVTEDTIDSTVWRCGPPHGRLTPPIGGPITNTQLYVLDDHLQPVPPGVAGEICLGGMGLARGYLNRPDLTAERFIPNPFSAAPGARMYRTGDLARYLPDGNIDFIGRTDFQVKIRGFRVEPGETEAVLRQHPAVREAIVVVRQDRPGDVRLTAYAVLHPQTTATPAQLQEYLRGLLPHYMIPSAIVVLESMPLTSSGKADRRALPPPDSATLASQSSVPPRTTTEAKIAEIWQTVLGLDQVGVHDNFFDLGGHSFLAMRAISLIEKQLGVRLSPRDFIFGTLAQLAASCDTGVGQQTKYQVQPDSTGTSSSSAAAASRTVGRVGAIRQTIKRLIGDKS